MAESREILYTVKLQNEATAAIAQLKSNLAGAFSGTGITEYAQQVKAASAEVVKHGAASKLSSLGSAEAAVAVGTHAKALSGLSKEIQNTTGHIDTHGSHVQRSLKEYREAEGGIHLLENAMKGFIALLAGNEILNMIDEYQTLTNRIRIVTESESEATAVRSKLVDVTMKSHTSLETTIEVYEKLRESTKGYGKTQNDAINMTKVLNQAFTLGTGSAERGAFAVSRFAMALQSGQIHGIEFNSILRQAPQLARIMEESLNKPAGYLKEAIREGKLKTSELIDGIVKAGPKIQEEFGKLPVTIKEGFKDFKTAAFVALGEVGEKLSSSSSIGKLFENMAKSLRDPAILKSIGDVAAAVGKVLREALELINTTIKILRDNVGLLAIAFGALAVVLSVGWINGAVLAFDALGKTGKALPGIFGLVEKAFLGLRTAALANPWVLLGAAIIAAVATLYLFGPSVKQVTDMLSNLWTIIKTLLLVLLPLGVAVGIYAIAMNAATVATWLGCTAIDAAAIATAAWNAILALNPIMLVVLAIAALVTAMITFGGSITNGISNWDRWDNRIKVAADNIKLWADVVKSYAMDVFNFIKTNSVAAAEILVGLATGNVGMVLAGVGGAGSLESKATKDKVNSAVAGRGNFEKDVAKRNAESRLENGLQKWDKGSNWEGKITDEALNRKGALENHAQRPEKKAKAAKEDPSVKALKAVQDYIDKLIEASDEAKKLSEAELLGPQALRNQEIINAGMKAQVEQTKKLEDAKEGLSKTSQGRDLIAQATEQARTSEIMKQQVAQDKLFLTIKKNNAETAVTTAVSVKAAQSYLLTGAALESWNEQSQIQAYIAKEMRPLYLLDYKSTIEFEKAKAAAIKETTAAAIAQAAVTRANAAISAVADFRKSVMGTADTRAQDAYAINRAKWMEGLNAKVKNADGSDSDVNIFSQKQRDETQKRIDSLKPPTTLFDAMRTGFVGFISELKPSLASVGDMVKGIGNKMTDAFVQLATTGKASFGDLARSIIADLLSMIVKALLFKAIMGLVNAVAPALGSTINSVIGGAVTGGGMQNPFAVPVHHTGGIIGDSISASRTVNSLTFAGANRHHSGGIAGLGTNEVPVIAERGEAILPTVRLPNGKMGVMAAGMGAAGGGGTSVQANINIINGSSGGGGGDNMSPEMKAKMGRMIEEEMNTHLSRKLEQWQRPGGPLDRSKR